MGWCVQSGAAVRQLSPEPIAVQMTLPGSADVALVVAHRLPSSLAAYTTPEFAGETARAVIVPPVLFGPMLVQWDALSEVRQTCVMPRYSVLSSLGSMATGAVNAAFSP